MSFENLKFKQICSIPVGSSIPNKNLSFWKLSSLEAQTSISSFRVTLYLPPRGSKYTEHMYFIKVLESRNQQSVLLIKNYRMDNAQHLFDMTRSQFQVNLQHLYRVKLQHLYTEFDCNKQNFKSLFSSGRLTTNSEIHSSSSDWFIRKITTTKGCYMLSKIL